MCVGDGPARDASLFLLEFYQAAVPPLGSGEDFIDFRSNDCDGVHSITKNQYEGATHSCLIQTRVSGA